MLDNRNNHCKISQQTKSKQTLWNNTKNSKENVRESNFTHYTLYKICPSLLVNVKTNSGDKQI